MADMDMRLNVFEDLMLAVESIYSWKYDSGGQLLFSNCPNESVVDELFTLGGCKERIVAECEQSNMSCFVTDTLNLMWLATPCKINNALVGIYTIGPVFASSISDANIEKALQSLDGSSEWKKEARVALRNTPAIQHTNYLRFGVMQHLCVTGEIIHTYDIRILLSAKTSKTNNRKSVSVEKRLHNSYAYEELLFKAIETGNIEFKKTENPPSVGMMNLRDPLRQAKTEIVVFVALATRAAMRGGLLEETAYGLSDQYIQMVEDETNLNNVYNYSSIVFEDFLSRVHNHKLTTGHSREIQRCIAYIETHIEEKFDYKEIAQEYGYSRNYFFSKFKKEVGVTPNEYVVQQKIELAKLWLLNTQKSIHDIAFSLSFGSDSYFGSVFRRIVGVSPSDYRNEKMDR